MRVSSVYQRPLNFKGLYDPYILVTGSSGYIGSHLIPKLADEGINCIVCCRNKKKQGYLESVVNEVNRNKIDKSSVSYSDIDLLNESDINKLIKNNKPIDAVIHLSGSTYNSESIINPRKYYSNNVVASENLLNAMLDNDIKHLIYLSTASIYTNPVRGKVSEMQNPNPKTPYAKTKFIGEQMINDYQVYGLKSSILRLFNVAGAHDVTDLDIGKNVITVLLSLIKEDRLFTLMGNNYKTKDGTCVKDFVHVDDVTDAIVKAFQKLMQNDSNSALYNLGTGVGTSLGELINLCIKNTGRDMQIRISDPLKDEIPCLIANNTRIKKELAWSPKKNIDDIITSCWQWIIRNGGKKCL